MWSRYDDVGDSEEAGNDGSGVDTHLEGLVGVWMEIWLSLRNIRC